MKLLTLLALSLWSSTAHAETPGRFTFLGENQCAPFEGVLFDPTATAVILADKSTSKTACDVRLKYELDIQAAEYELQLQNLQIRHNALTSEYNMRIQSMQRETDALVKALKRQSRKNTGLWLAAGIVSGVALSYGAYQVINEQ